MPFAALLAIVLSGTSWPKNLSVSAGGLSTMASQLSNVCWHDKKNGFFALKTVECDGAHRMVMITKDRRVVGDFGYDTARFGRKPKYDGADAKIVDHTVSLATSHGISIGMTISQVKNKLGSPTKSATKGAKDEFWCALYKKVHMDSKEEGEVLRNTYIFKKGKLVEIAINLDSVPGCGEDSLSDEGWPWTKF